MTAGVPVELELRYRAELLEKRMPRIGVGMLPPDPELLGAAVRTTQNSDVAVVVVNDLRTEGSDISSLALPGDQNELVAAVAAANPRTIVVLHTAGAVLMPWLDDVAAVLAAWYPGETNGNALADILFGDVSPSGRLPMTFPAPTTSTRLRATRWPTQAVTASCVTPKNCRSDTGGGSPRDRCRCSRSGTG